MKRKRYSVEQIVSILKQAELGLPVSDLIRQVGISEQTFYRWKKQYAGLQSDQVRELKQVTKENARLKRSWWRSSGWTRPYCMCFGTELGPLPIRPYRIDCLSGMAAEVGSRSAPVGTPPGLRFRPLNQYRRRLLDGVPFLCRNRNRNAVLYKWLRAPASSHIRTPGPKVRGCLLAPVEARSISDPSPPAARFSGTVPVQ